jgi:hypothetical protein
MREFFMLLEMLALLGNCAVVLFPIAFAGSYGSEEMKN